MCGIAGIYNSASDMAPSVQQLSKMIAQLAHRGPDGFGIYSEEKIGFAHARLSIIDLQTGSQPVHNEDRTIWVIFNGEIFNYIELRTELVNKGHRFYTESDTEVIVHLYEQYGEKFVDYLNGQFAIALWDAKQKKLLLVRDRVGIHPLYYYQEHGKLFFASEIKAILAVCQKIPALNVVALDQLMTFWSPVSPLTMFENIYEVSPGEIVLIKGSEIVKSLHHKIHAYRKEIQ